MLMFATLATNSGGRHCLSSIVDAAAIQIRKDTRPQIMLRSLVQLLLMPKRRWANTVFAKSLCTPALALNCISIRSLTALLLSRLLLLSHASTESVIVLVSQDVQSSKSRSAKEARASEGKSGKESTEKRH